MERQLRHNGRRERHNGMVETSNVILTVLMEFLQNLCQQQRQNGKTERWKPGITCNWIDADLSQSLYRKNWNNV